MPSVLIVCTANICRSPMAAAILKQLVAKRQDANEWRIESAGTWANEGSPAAAMSRFVMESMGMDISSHQSQPVSLELLQQFDLILTMESNHKESLQVGFPEFANNIYLLSEIIGLEQDIWDPIGGELADFRETAQELEYILSIGLERIDQLARSFRK